MISRSGKGERDWKSEHTTLSEDKRQISHTEIDRKLQEILRDMAQLEAQGKVEGFFTNAENAGKLGGLVEDIRDAMMEYQVCESSYLFVPCLIFALDFAATRYLQQATRYL